MNEIILQTLKKMRTDYGGNEMIIFAQDSDLQVVANEIEEAINYTRCCTTLNSEETMSFDEVKHLEYKHNVLNKVLDKQQADVKLKIFENGEWVEVPL